MKMTRSFGMMLMGACLALAACTTGVSTSTGGPAPPGLSEAPPAPLAATQIDDKAVKLGWESLKAVTEAVTALRKAGVIKPGTPRAIAIADTLDATAKWLTAATEAQRLGQQANYAAALLQVEATFTAIRRALE